jgi:CheY-like chemotaxis protein
MEIAHAPAIIMVTAYGREEASKKAEGLDIVRFLVKPITPSSLLDAVMAAQGYAYEEIRPHKPYQQEVADAIEALFGARILVVEDNDVNQELATELLRLHGMEVGVAQHGAEALEMLESQSFDGVLMDCQMPVMDGYEATRRLRASEAHKALPIIAMTANAMSRDKEKSLAAGMNDHITKPIQFATLFTTMSKWITSSSPQASQKKQEQPNRIEIAFPDLFGIDVSSGLETCMGNRQLLWSLLVRFRTEQRSFIDTFEKALLEDESDTMVHLAHSLKGASGTIGAKQLYKLSAALEKASSSPENEQSERIFHALSEELDRVLDGLDVLDAQLEPAPPTKEVEREEVNEILVALQAHIQHFEVEAVEVAKQLHQIASLVGYSSFLHRIVNHLHEYDFIKAGEVLEELLEEVSSS